MKAQITTAMVVNFGEKELNYCFTILESLHDLNISAEIYPEPAKMKKQMAYADAKKIQYVLLAGEDEIKNNEVTIKIMETGKQKKIGLGELESFFK
jgi:histidyl-tRNA synthetase